jgi:hypothetical protein
MALQVIGHDYIATQFCPFIVFRPLLHDKPVEDNKLAENLEAVWTTFILVFSL